MTLDPEQKPLWELLDFEKEEQEYILFDSVTSEFNNIAGFPIEYWTLTYSPSGTDHLYGENQTQGYEGPLYTKLLYEPTSEPELTNMFGITSDDTIEIMQITKTVLKTDTNIEVPKAGDLIKTLWNNKTYEIVEVSSENKIFQGMKMIWDFICRPYRFDYQSDSADEFLFADPDSDEFPDINITTETETPTVSGDTVQEQYGDNEYIKDESSDISNDVDSSIYGY